MKYIKLVMNERRLAYLGAVSLAEKRKEEEMNAVVHQTLVGDFLATRREHRRITGRKARWSLAQKRARREAHEELSALQRKEKKQEAKRVRKAQRNAENQTITQNIIQETVQQ